MHGEPLDLFISSADPEACYLINLPDRIWVFGGPAAEKHEPSASLRDSFWRQTFTCTARHDWLQHLDQPEAHPGWLHFSGYSDLLEFERDACYLARGVVLFAESPGSYAELGALAIDDSILPRLLVVTKAKFLQEPFKASFLNLGPLKRADKSVGLCVIHPVSDTILSPEDFGVIAEQIGPSFPANTKSAALDRTNPTHVLLLLADLVDLLLVSKMSDLVRAMAFFSISISSIKLDRSLSLLEFFGLIRREQRGREVFWVRVNKSTAPWVDYTGKVGARFDRSRFKIQALTAIQNDPSRKSIFERPQ